MTPAAAIAMLDRQLDAHGQSVSFRRGAGGTPTDGVKGFVRGFSPEQLVGTITQADRHVVVSPTTLAGYEPRIDDQFATLGKVGKVMSAEPVHMDGTLVRYNVVVRMS